MHLACRPHLWVAEPQTNGQAMGLVMGRVLQPPAVGTWYLPVAAAPSLHDQAREPCGGPMDHAQPWMLVGRQCHAGLQLQQLQA